MTEIETRRRKVFEVDTAYQLDRKRRALASAGVKLPAHVVHIPFDFDTRDLEGDLGGALQVAGFQPGVGAMFVWEGERHRLSIDRWFYPCSYPMHHALADMYEGDERFAQNIDRYGAGLARFVAAAVRANAARHRT